MKRFLFTLVFTFLTSSFLIGQCPDDYILLSSQSQIDSFPINYPDCNSIYETLFIIPDSPETDDITNLDSLVVLDTIINLNVRRCNYLTKIELNEDVHIVTLTVSRSPLIETIPIINNVDNSGWLVLSALSSFDQNENYSVDSLGVLNLSEMPVTSLNFLGGIQDIKQWINIYDNPDLTDISQLEELNTPNFYLTNNANLSLCSIGAVCRALGEDVNSVEIEENGPDCRDIFDVYYNCYPDSEDCVFDEISIRSQTDMEQLSLLPDLCVESVKKVSIKGVGNTTDPVTDLSNLIRFKELEILDIEFNSELSSLAGADSLHTIKELTLRSNPKIKNFKGFDKLKYVEELYISSMDSLSTISHADLILEGCNRLEIRYSPVNDLSAFIQLDSLNYLKLLATDVKNMDWATELAMVDHVEIIENDSIESFSFLGIHPVFGDLIINENESLSEISGIAFKDSIISIEIKNNPLSSLSIINGPKQVSNKIDISNTYIPELHSWPGVEEANAIFITNNPHLKEMQFLKGFSQITSLSITGNDSLRHIGAEPLVMEQLGHLYILRNPLLSDVSVLDYNFNIDRITIRDNPSLAFCDALAICKEYKSIDPDISLSGNGEKCNLVDLNFECKYGNNAYGDVKVKSQADIDSVEQFFPLMDSVFGNLIIDFSLNPEGANFIFFDNIQFVRDRLEIRYPRTNGVFELFEGAKVGGLLLANLETESLDIIEYQDELSIFRLTSVEGLEDFKGLENVKEIRDVDIVYCPIKSADGLDSLNFANEFQIVDCPELEDISAFSNFERVRDFRLAVLPKVKGLGVFDSLIVISDLQLNAVPFMTEIPAFDVGRSLRILSLLRNEGITEVVFDSLESISQYFFISEHPNLENVSFQSLKNVGTASMSNNDNLITISLSSLQSASSSLAFRNNERLEDLLGVNPETITPKLEIHDNTMLQHCNVELICNNVSAGAELRIENNAGCQTLEDVLPQCTVSIDNLTESILTIFPNPNDGSFYISGDFEEQTMYLLNSQGQKVKFLKQGSEYRISNKLPGIYFLKYQLNGKWYVEKILKF